MNLIGQIEERLAAERQTRQEIILSAKQFVQKKRTSWMDFIPAIRRADMAVLVLALSFDETTAVERDFLLHWFKTNPIFASRQNDLTPVLEAYKCR